jgi:hypothetical protein
LLAATAPEALAGESGEARAKVEAAGGVSPGLHEVFPAKERAKLERRKVGDTG